MRYALVAKIPVGSKSHRRLPSVQCNVRWNGAPPGERNGERLIAMGERYPPGNDHIFHLRERKIIDSKVLKGMGYVSSQEGRFDDV